MIVLTSRPAVFSAAVVAAEIDNSYSKIEVFGFSKTQIKEYISLFPFSSLSDDSVDHANNLQNYLSCHPGVLDLCYLPVNCAIVCFIYNIEPTELPDTQTQIFALFTRLIISRQLITNNISIQLNSIDDLVGEEATDFKNLCSHALNMAIDSKQVISLEKVNMDESRSLGLVTADVTAGLKGYQSTYCFLHLTLQEFLAAYHLSKLNQEMQFYNIEKYGGIISMRNVWKFFFGILDSKLALQSAQKLFATFNISFNHQLTKVLCSYEAKLASICHLAYSSGGFNFVETLNAYDISAIAYAMSSLADQGGQNEAVTSLRFQSWGPGNDKLKTLISQLNNSAIEHLQSLQFYQCDNSISDINTLANKLKLNRMGHSESHKFKSLRQLSLSAMDMNDKSVALLAASLHCNKVLEELNLTINSITADGVSTLLRSDCHLQNLNLSGNKLGVEGAQAVARGLMGNVTLKHLNLANNKIGDEGAGAVARGLVGNIILKHLDLSKNELSDEGAGAVARGIEGNITLVSIDLAHNRIGIAGVRVFAHVLQGNTIYLDLHYCKPASRNTVTSTFNTLKLSETNCLLKESRQEDLLQRNNCMLNELNLAHNVCIGNPISLIPIFQSLSHLDLSHNSIDLQETLAIVDYAANSDSCQRLQYLGLSSSFGRSAKYLMSIYQKHDMYSGLIIDLSYIKIGKQDIIGVLQEMKKYNRVHGIDLTGSIINIDKQTIGDLKQAFQHEKIIRNLIIEIPNQLFKVPASCGVQVHQVHNKASKLIPACGNSLDPIQARYSSPKLIPVRDNIPESLQAHVAPIEQALVNVSPVKHVPTNIAPIQHVPAHHVNSSIKPNLAHAHLAENIQAQVSSTDTVLAQLTPKPIPGQANSTKSCSVHANSKKPVSSHANSTESVPALANSTESVPALANSTKSVSACANSTEHCLSQVNSTEHCSAHTNFTEFVLARANSTESHPTLVNYTEPCSAHANATEPVSAHANSAEPVPSHANSTESVPAHAHSTQL